MCIFSMEDCASNGRFVSVSVHHLHRVLFCCTLSPLPLSQRNISVAGKVEVPSKKVRPLRTAPRDKQHLELLEFCQVSRFSRSYSGAFRLMSSCQQTQLDFFVTVNVAGVGVGIGGGRGCTKVSGSSFLRSQLVLFLTSPPQKKKKKVAEELVKTKMDGPGR